MDQSEVGDRDTSIENIKVNLFDKYKKNASSGFGTDVLLSSEKDGWVNQVYTVLKEGVLVDTSGVMVGDDTRIFMASLTNPFLMAVFARHYSLNNIDVSQDLLDGHSFTGIVRDSLSRSGTTSAVALSRAKKWLFENGTSIDSMEHIINELYIPSLILTRDPETIETEKYANTAKILDIGKGFDALVLRCNQGDIYFRHLASAMMHPRFECGFHFKDVFPEVDLDKYQVIQKVGIYPNITFSPVLAEQGFPAHNTLLTLLNVQNKDKGNPPSTILIWRSEEVQLPGSLAELDDKEYMEGYVYPRLERSTTKMKRYVQSVVSPYLYE